MQSKKESVDHDKLARRLTEILSKLNNGEKLEPQALATEFNVNLRTVQRDLNERFHFLPLEKSGVHYRLDPAYLGRISLSDVGRFASLAGVRGLFPSLSDNFLREIFDSRVQTALLVKGQQFEDLSSKTVRFEQLKQAILIKNKINYSYQKSDGLKPYVNVEPYKLVNKDGVWYLAAKEGGKLKSFMFSKIDRLQVSNDRFETDPKVEKTLADEDDIWLNEKKIEIVLKITGLAADYFRRRQLVSSQVIEKELEDGGLIVSTKVAHINQIVPTVRYWIPHIRIISPEGQQAEMERQIQAYLCSS